MRLLITDPISIVADHADIAAVRAEDESGSFGILPGHADLLTVLVPSVAGLAARGRAARLLRRAPRRVDGARRARGGGGDPPGRAPATTWTNSSTSCWPGSRPSWTPSARCASKRMRLHMQAIRQIVQLLRPVGRDAGGSP